MGIGLQGAYAADSLQQLLARRKAEQLLAEHFATEQANKQQEFGLRQRSLDQNDQFRNDQLALQRDTAEQTAKDRQVGLANTIADQLPPGQFMAPNDPAVGFLRSGGRGSLLTEQQARPAVDVGPLLPGDTGGARQQGFIKSASQKQQEDLRKQSDTEADNARQAKATAEAERHNREMEKRPPFGATVVVQGPDGPVLVDKRGGGSKPVTGPDGTPLGQAPTTQERNTKIQYKKARPILSAISDLSEKINVNQGVMAKVQGAEAQAAAKLNLNDDVAEYEAMISGFTPLIARALGHTGVLTEQDVQSVKTMFPKPGDSKSLRDRKVARIQSLMGDIEGGGGATPVTADPLGLRKK